jgi:hypothetical protein
MYSWIPSRSAQCRSVVARFHTNKLSNDVVHLDDLQISFHRTVNVPDNRECSELPPNLGKFPLFQVRNYADKVHPEMAAKGGIFLPMYREFYDSHHSILRTNELAEREAMWIRFRSTKLYAIKIYVGAVNAVSGEPAVETAAT